MHISGKRAYRVDMIGVFGGMDGIVVIGAIFIVGCLLIALRGGFR